MKKNDYIKKLFMKEITVLEEAVNYLGQNSHDRDEILQKYEELTHNYKRLLEITKKICTISDTQGTNLKRREQDIKNLLDNTSQGFLTFGENFLVDREYSSECGRIFKKRISNVSILELLKSENQEQNKLFQEVLGGFFRDCDFEDKVSLLAKLPVVIKINDSFINVNYKPILKDMSEQDELSLMLILTDITEKRKAEDEVAYLSYHDKLTSLYNRTYIENIEYQLLSSSNFPLSIIMADLNALKLTNDVFGHEAGDRLLKNMADVFVSCCRKKDIIARWGGDEFIIILPNSNKEDCLNVISRIRDACFNAGPDPIHLSVSMGSVTIENMESDIIGFFSAAENMMYSNKIEERRQTRRRIISDIEKVLYSKCYKQEDHISRVKAAALEFGRILGYEASSKEMSELEMLAEFHDIGKVAIPSEILDKRGTLSHDEWQIMLKATQIGYRMAQSIDEPLLAQSILSLRERWDGRGYPNGLSRNGIPLNSRLIAILDAYDVMTHDRPYKKRSSCTEAAGELQRCSGSQFDPELVNVFLQNLSTIYHV
ncbi:MAG: diguanylate cyclase [Bacillota bacterium]|nr:diguanylate cyclase [Bacillota bacterium]